jgi:glyoxylase-like metal-dependent hydrolase (beta-lactamase superfamily II)
MAQAQPPQGGQRQGGARVGGPAPQGGAPRGGGAPGAGFGPQQLTTTKVNDWLYMIRDASSGNCNVLISDEGLIIIDTKFERSFDGIMEKIREFSDKPVLFVINTHLHDDHSQGNARFQGLNAHVVASENARTGILNGRGTGVPTVTLEERMRIYLDDKPLDLYWLGRGHTNGDVVIHLPTENMVFTGDLFATFEPYVWLIDYSAGGSGVEWPKTLEKVLALDFDTVIPGHGGVTDRAMLEGYLAETNRQAETVREMVSANRSREDIQTMLQTEFGWSAFMFNFGLEGLINEVQ